ncbi:hypothetical protein [Compostibacter hankyongensis]|uniref:Type 1 periplasmic binding fold superfamily protein n=1 Tax=Compostibacter hankyongensis TaxID=1007089 RepID=A0ABP8G899_9BACT
MKKAISLTGIAMMVLLWNACNKDEEAVAPPVPGNEFLTTVELKVTNENDPSDTQTASWKDMNPDDDTPPDVSAAKLTLKPNAKYKAEVLFWDDTQSPRGDVTEEIKERENYHLVCFTVSSGLNLTVKRTDHDTNTPALEVGLEDEFTTGATGAGKLNVQLRHQPNVKDGTCEPGSTDADVNYDITIQ